MAKKKSIVPSTSTALRDVAALNRRRDGQAKGAPSRASNPFEERVQKIKRPILGRNSSVGSGGAKAARARTNIVQRRQQAQERRDQTLRFALEREGRANRMVDSRILKPAAAQEPASESKAAQNEAALARWQRERAKQFKRSKFSLDDADGDGAAVLTHGGKVLGAGGSYDAPVMNDAEEEDDAMFSESELNTVVKSAPDTTVPREGRTTKEIYDEIIAKSKERRAERMQRQQEKFEQLQSLDSAFDAVRQDIMSMRRTEEDNDSIPKTADAVVYDTLVREFGFDSRASATEKLDSPEEIAENRRSALLALEEERRRRMGLGDDAETGLNPAARERRRAEQVSRHAQRAIRAQLEDAESGLSEAQAGALPYVFDALPATGAALDKILSGHSVPEQSVLIRRLVGCFHPSLEDGKYVDGVCTLVVLLLKRVERCATQSEADMLYKALFGVLHELARARRDSNATATLILFAKHPLLGVLREYLAGVFRSMRRGSSPHFPAPGKLLALATLLKLFPATDFQHVVVTPILIFFCECLNQVPLLTCADVLSGLFICSVIVGVCEQDDSVAAAGQRLFGEVAQFLASVIALTTDDIRRQIREQEPDESETDSAGDEDRIEEDKIEEDKIEEDRIEEDRIEGDDDENEDDDNENADDSNDNEDSSQEDGGAEGESHGMRDKASGLFQFPTLIATKAFSSEGSAAFSLQSEAKYLQLSPDNMASAPAPLAVPAFCPRDYVCAPQSVLFAALTLLSHYAHYCVEVSKQVADTLEAPFHSMAVRAVAVPPEARHVVGELLLLEELHGKTAQVLREVSAATAQGTQGGRKAVDVAHATCRVAHPGGAAWEFTTVKRKNPAMLRQEEPSTAAIDTSHYGAKKEFMSEQEREERRRKEERKEKQVKRARIRDLRKDAQYVASYRNAQLEKERQEITKKGKQIMSELEKQQHESKYANMQKERSKRKSMLKL